MENYLLMDNLLGGKTLEMVEFHIGEKLTINKSSKFNHFTEAIKRALLLIISKNSTMNSNANIVKTDKTQNKQTKNKNK